MKNIAMLAASVVCIATLSAHGAYTITASRDYVDKKVYTLQTNLEERIGNVQPGNYSVVSNKAMNALQDTGGTIYGSLTVQKIGNPFTIRDWDSDHDFYDLTFGIYSDKWGFTHKAIGVDVDDPYIAYLPEKTGVIALDDDVSDALGVAKNYTDNATNSLGIALRREISSAQPADYATVSNRAMNALQTRAGNDDIRYIDNDIHFENGTYFGTEYNYFNNGFFFGDAESHRIFDLGFVGASNNLVRWPTSSGQFALTNDIPAVPSWAMAETKPTYTAAEVGAYSTNTIDTMLQSYLPLDYFQNGQTIPMYWGDGTKLCDFGANWLGNLVNTVNEKPDASDIPTSMAWSAITDKPTTISGYGITDALKEDFTSLTNSMAFTSAVEEVSPPADTSDCIKYLDEGDEIPSEGIYLAYSHNYAYVTNVTGYVTNVVDSVTNIVEVYSVTTNSYPVVSLYRNGTKVWTSDPADTSNYGWLIALILALVGSAGAVLWKYFWSADTVVLTVVAATRDGATVTGQTFTVYMGEDANGRVVAENVAYDGEPVAIEFPRRAKYYIAISDKFSSIQEFSSSAAYEKGDRVKYEGETYRFTKDHAANTAWSADEVEDVGVATLYDHFAPNTASGTANMDTVVTLTYMDAGINPDYVPGTSAESVPQRNIHSLTELKIASAAIKAQYDTDSERISAGLELLIGVELPDTWVSDDATPVTRQDPKIVADYGYCTDKNGNQIIGAVLMCKWATQRDIQFDPRNQEVAAESTAQTWDDNGTTKPVYYYGWAPPYNNASAYTKDTTFCTYDNRLWKCSTAIAAGGEEWNSAHWTAQGYINNSVTTTSSSILPFDPTADYVAGSFCYYTDTERGFTGIYKCTNAVSSGQWNAADWTLTVFDILEASLTKLSLSVGDSLPTGYAAIFRTSLNASGNYVQNAIRYGHNNYGTSAQRQYFNDESNEPIKWWKQQHPGQIAPFNPGTSTVKGWLSGCSEELRGLITEVKVPCYSNSNTDSAQGAYTTTDKVFMLSGTQFCGNVNANEGHILPYLSRYLIECVEDGNPGANNGHTVVRLATWADRPVTGTSGVTYFAKDTGFIYAWRDDTNAYTGVLNNDDGGWYRDHRTKTIQHYDVKENPAEGQTAFPAIADASTSVAYYDDSTNKVWRKNNNAWQDISDQYYVYLATGGLYNNYRRRYRINSHGSAAAVRLRSANRGYSSNVWLVSTYGTIASNSANNAYASVPACVIQ